MNNTSKTQKFTIDESIYATHGQRIANYFIDYAAQILLMFGILTVIMIIAMGNGYTETDIAVATESLSSLEQYGIALIIILIYYNFFEILFAQTVGKFITKTVVVDAFGDKPTTNEILLRSICRAIPFEFITFLGMHCRGWHDRFSDTYVVQKELLATKKKAFNAFNANPQHPTPNT